MRVLTVIESLDEQGGAERFVVDLAAELHDQGHHCEVVALWPPYSLAGELEELGIPVHRLDLDHRRQVGRAVLRLRKLMRASDPDVVHAHLYFPAVYTAMARWPGRRTRGVVTLHFPAYEQFPARGPAQRLRKRLDRWATGRRADLAIAVSDAVASHYVKELRLSRRPHVIRNGVQLSDLRSMAGDTAATRAELGVAAGDGWLICPSRLAEQKDHDLLLDALVLLRARGIRPRIDIAGDGPLRARLETRVAKEGLGEQVVFRGRVEHSELIRLMAASSAVVLPSKWEGLGLVLVEAQAVGTPVVASAVGGVTEIVEEGQTGLLVPPADAVALADQLERVLTDEPLVRAMVRNATDQVQEEHELGSVARSHERLYEALLRSARA